MDITYRTVAGDEWDAISFRVYKSEFHIARLINANIAYREVEVFPANVELVIPELPAAASTAANLPPWKTGAAV